MAKAQDANNIIAVVKQHNRVRNIEIRFVQISFMKKLRAMRMEDPFLILTSLRLHSQIRSLPALPDSFLGGSVPRLQTIVLEGIPFPALPTLLCLPMTLLSFAFWTFLFLDIFHPRQWSLASPR
jgi:hypothetical protein